MRKLLLFVALFVIIAIIGVGVYLYLNMEGESPTGESGTQNGTGTVEFADIKPPETFPDMLDAIDFFENVNSDTIAWLNVPGTDISGPVMQTVNNSYYLRLNETQQYDVYGCYFADYECSTGNRDEISDNTIIYGHSELNADPDGMRFSQLFRYVDPEFAKLNPVVHYSTLREYMTFEIFSVFYTDSDEFYYIAVDSEPEIFGGIIDTALTLSIHDYGITPTSDDRIITLSTCNAEGGANTTGRFVVMARLIAADDEVPQVANIA